MNILLLLVLGAIAAVIVWIAIVAGRARRPHASTGPVCGACGYSVVGLTTMTCPECGGDLRSVGIVTPHARQGAGWIATAAAFTVLLGLIAVIVTPTLFSVIPLRRSTAKTLYLTGPKSNAYQAITLHTQGATWTTDRLLLPVQINLTPNPATTKSASPPAPRMTLRPGGAYEFATPSSPRPTIQPQGFGPNAILQWMNAAGVDTTQPAVREEAALVAGEARLLSRAGRGMSGIHAGSSSSSSSGGSSLTPFASYSSTQTAQRLPPPWVGPPIALFWLVTWFSGLRFLARRSARPLRRDV